jgi:hypothetical protein
VGREIEPKKVSAAAEPGAVEVTLGQMRGIPWTAASGRQNGWARGPGALSAAASF